MAEVKHTPGPFSCDESGVIRAPSGRMVARAHLGAELLEGGKAKRLANAHLIAAAPEMKEALEEVLRWDAYPNTSCRKRIEAALDKANGTRPPLPPTARCE